MSMEIEKFLRENPEESGAGKSTLDIVSDFLHGDDLPDLRDTTTSTTRVI